MSTKPLVAVAAVTAALAVSAGFPIGQSASGLGLGVANASPCPPFLPCKGPPKVPGLGSGSKGPRLPAFGGGPTGPRLPDFGGGPKGPRLPAFGGGPAAPRLPEFRAPGPRGGSLRGPGDIRHGFTAGGLPVGPRVDVARGLRVPMDLRHDFGLHALGGPAARLRGDFRVGAPWLIRPRGDFGLNFRGPWPWVGRVPADILRGFHWLVGPGDLRMDWGLGRLLDLSDDWQALLNLAPPPWRGGLAPWGLGPAPWGWGAPPAPDWAGWIPPPWGPAPAPFDYWGLTVIPVWDPDFQQWGFWEFGIWIPLPGQ